MTTRWASVGSAVRPRPALAIAPEDSDDAITRMWLRCHRRARVVLRDVLAAGIATRMGDLGRLLIVVGCITVAVGVLLMVAPKLPWLGHLPADFLVRRERVTFYFPLATSIVVSLILTLILNLFFRR